jgi:hypothetical protein
MTRPDKTSITAHPAFPLVVALWFAALLGLGSLILPLALFERLVSATGFAELLPAAAPPLGATARVGIALLGAVFGAALGLFAARNVARAAPAGTRRRGRVALDSNSRRPLSPRDELGSDSFDSVTVGASARRRTFSSAPAPAPADQAPVTEASGEEPLDLDECTALAEASEPAPEPNAAAEHELAITDSPVEHRRVLARAGGRSDPLLFSPPSLARGWPIDEGDDEESADLSEWGIDGEAAPLVVARTADDEPDADPDASTGGLEQLGLVQLVQRLGTTLARHRAWVEQRVEATPASASFPRAVAERDFGMAAPAEAAQAMAAFFSPPAEPALPAEPAKAAASPQAPPQPARGMRPLAAFSPLAGDDHDADEHEADARRVAASLSLPLGRHASGAATPDRTGSTSPSEAYGSSGDARTAFDSPQAPFTHYGFAHPTAPRAVQTHPAPPSRPEAPRDAANPAPGPRPFDPPANVRPKPADDEDDDARALRDAVINLQWMATKR